MPRPSVAVRALVPYDRGDLVNKIHQFGEFVSQEHTPDGTLLDVRVNPDLAAELAAFVVAD